jgi:hypothetical protein
MRSLEANWLIGRFNNLKITDELLTPDRSFAWAGNALELGLRVRADPVRVNTRGFRLHGYFQAGDCSSSRNEE